MKKQRLEFSGDEKEFVDRFRVKMQLANVLQREPMLPDMGFTGSGVKRDSNTRNAPTPILEEFGDTASTTITQT